MATNCPDCGHVLYAWDIGCPSCAQRSRAEAERFSHQHREKQLRHLESFPESFQGMDLSNADLSHKTYELSGKDLSNADLRGSRLNSSRLRKSNLTNADLRNAILYGTDLAGAILTGTKLEGASWDGGTKWPDGFDPRRHGTVELVFAYDDNVGSSERHVRHPVLARKVRAIKVAAWSLFVVAGLIVMDIASGGTVPKEPGVKDGAIVLLALVVAPIAFAGYRLIRKANKLARGPDSRIV